MEMLITDIFLKQILNIQKNLFNGVGLSLHSDLPFLPERNKIEKNVISLFVTLMTKKNYVVDINAFKQALNHGLILKKEQIVI